MAGFCISGTQQKEGFPAEMLYVPFLAAAHRWDDPQALTREDR